MNKKDEKMNLAVSGQSFEQIMDSKNEEKLQKACQKAKSVIFTSMENYQRPVRLFTQRPSKEILHRIRSRCSVRLARTTCVLVVGGSSNDIAMMEEGDISVLKKIQSEDSSGCSVTEADNVADFAISGKEN